MLTPKNVRDNIKPRKKFQLEGDIMKNLDTSKLMEVLEKMFDRQCHYGTYMLCNKNPNSINFLFKESEINTDKLEYAAKLAYYYLQIKTKSSYDIESLFIRKLRLKLTKDKELATNIMGFVLTFTGDQPFTKQPQIYKDSNIPYTNLGNAKIELLRFLLTNNAIGLTTTFMGISLIQLPLLGAHYIIEPNMNQWKNLPREIKSHPYTEDFIAKVQNEFQNKLNEIIEINTRLEAFTGNKRLDTTNQTNEDLEETALSEFTYNEHLIDSFNLATAPTFGSIRDEILNFIIYGTEPSVTSFEELGNKHKIPYPKDKSLADRIIWLKQVNDHMLKTIQSPPEINLHIPKINAPNN